jgi:hypothetical protein
MWFMPPARLIKEMHKTGNENSPLLHNGADGVAIENGLRKSGSGLLGSGWPTVAPGPVSPKKEQTIDNNS